MSHLHLENYSNLFDKLLRCLFSAMQRLNISQPYVALFINFWQCNVNMLRKLILSVRYRKEKEAFTKKIAIIVHNMETRIMILKSLGNLYHQFFVNRSKKEYEIFCTPLE